MSAPPPVPQGDYLPARRHRDLIFTSGMTPREAGVLTHHGPIRASDPLEDHADAVRLACRNALTAARATLAEGEAISAILSLTVYLVTEPGFTAHSRLADIASADLRAELGEAGIGSRAAVGVATLPGNAAIEIALVAAV
ncbi:RidA family protein [uncultured Paracoccus sp.]|uniref:RidA family protein n=1 Tax=uncultured Paracoccus sp. TaxID=189685 RepID=UPI00263975DA|nr:RidA family protein [uncultured Paracoccus sp.]